MNLFKTRASARRPGMLACIMIAAALTGCSAGQVSQTATQEPAVNGTQGSVGDIAVRDVRIVAEQKREYEQKGTAELAFVATNQSPDTSYTLQEITSPVGTVKFTGDRTIQPRHALIVGAPENGQPDEMVVTPDLKRATAQLTLTEPISNGLTYEVTFTFEGAGDIKIQVPVTAADDAKRLDEEPSQGEGHGEGH